DNKSFGNSKRLLESPVRLNSRQHREPRSWFCGAHTMDCVDGQPTMSKTADESCHQEQAPRLARDGFDGEMANPNPFTGYWSLYVTLCPATLPRSLECRLGIKPYWRRTPVTN